MGTEVSWMSELNVNPGSEEELRALINDAVTARRTNERHNLKHTRLESKAAPT